VITLNTYRGVATRERLEKMPAFNRRSATAGTVWAANRRLKPTVTFTSSLRDDGSATLCPASSGGEGGERGSFMGRGELDGIQEASVVR
jgi:hypothetical protein